MRLDSLNNRKLGSYESLAYWRFVCRGGWLERRYACTCPQSLCVQTALQKPTHRCLIDKSVYQLVSYCEQRYPGIPDGAARFGQIAVSNAYGVSRDKFIPRGGWQYLANLPLCCAVQIRKHERDQVTSEMTSASHMCTIGSNTIGVILERS